jgi:ammonia channel protein AmtB
MDYFMHRFGFFMNTSLALLESGLCRPQNAVNILSKNVIVFGVNTNMAVCAGLLASTLASIFINRT